MDFLKKLLDGVAVEWKALGDLGAFIRGNGMQKKDFVVSGFPAIHYGQIYTKYGLSADKTFVYVSEELAKKILSQEEITIMIDLNLGEYNATAYGCDLTYDYVKINGDYRT